jgi:flavodoxin I
MKILILYATYTGGTETAAQTVSETLSSNGHTITLKVVTEANSDEFNSYDVILMCTPTWDFNGKEGQPHEDFISFIEKLKEKDFSGIKFAILGLGDSSYTHFCGSVDVLENFVKETKSTLLCPSLRVDGYFYDQEKNTNLIKDWTNKIK